MIIFTILFGLIGLGIIVFIHEFGHFIAAKLCGVDVEIFSLGWGNKLVGFDYKGTTYQLAWFPIGGFCKMKGELSGTNLDDDELDRLRHEKGSFLGASAWKKIIISFAGPFANILMAVIVFIIFGLLGQSDYSLDNKIILATDYTFYSPADDNTPAQKAGLQSGDKIIAIDNQPIRNFGELGQVIEKNAGNSLVFTIERVETGSNQTATLTLKVVPAESAYKRGFIGIFPYIEPVIGEVKHPTDDPMFEIRPGDRIISIDGKIVKNSIEVEQILRDKLVSPGIIDLPVRILRKDSELARKLRFKVKADKSFDLYFNYRLDGLDLGNAAVYGLNKTGELFSLIIESFAMLGEVKRIDEAVGGPIRIINLIGDSAAGGTLQFFNFISLLSVIIAFMNLLPMPVLDGGTVVVSFIEGLRRKPFTAKTLLRLQIVGAVFIFIMIALAIASDAFHYLPFLG